MSFKYKVGTADPDARGAATVIAPGNYEFHLEQFSKERKQTQTAGDDMVGIFLKCVDHNGAPVGYVWDNLVFSDAASWRIEQFLRSIQMGEEGDEVDFGVQNEPAFIGAIGYCRIKNKPGRDAAGKPTGEMRSEVDAYLVDLNEPAPAAKPAPALRGAVRGPAQRTAPAPGRTAGPAPARGPAPRRAAAAAPADKVGAVEEPDDVPY